MFGFFTKNITVVETEKKEPSLDDFLIDKVQEKDNVKAFQKMNRIVDKNRELFISKFNGERKYSSFSIKKKIALNTTVDLLIDLDFGNKFPEAKMLLQTSHSATNVISIKLWAFRNFELDNQKINQELFSDELNIIFNKILNFWMYTFEDILNNEKALLTSALDSFSLTKKEEKSPLVRRIEEKIVPALSASFSQLPESEQLKRVDDFEQTLMSLKEKVALVQKEEDSSDKVLTYERQLAVAIGFSKV